MTFIKYLKEVLKPKYLGKTLLDNLGEPFVVKNISCKEDCDGLDIVFSNKKGNYNVPGFQALRLVGSSEFPKVISNVDIK